MAPGTTFEALSWELDNRRVKISPPGVMHLALTIRNPSQDHGGKYTCKATFRVASFHPEPPRITDAGYLNMYGM